MLEFVILPKATFSIQKRQKLFVKSTLVIVPMAFLDDELKVNYAYVRKNMPVYSFLFFFLFLRGICRFILVLVDNHMPCLGKL